MIERTLRKIITSNISNKIISNLKDNVYKVAIDGFDGAGKTTFADELATDLRAKKINVIRSLYVKL